MRRATTARIAVAAAILVVGLGVSATSASALTVPPPAAWIGTEVLPDGASALVAVAPGSIAWQACLLGGERPPCEPLAGESNGRLPVPDHLVGWTFVATSDQLGSGHSHPYRGRIAATGAPAVVGALRVGGSVGVAGATWRGGFPAVDRSEWQLQACRDLGGTQCVTLADSYYWNRCPRTGTIVPQRYEGWYVRAVERRVGSLAVNPAFQPATPEDVHPYVPAPPTVVGSGMEGPIGPGSEPQGPCVPPTRTAGPPSPDPRAPDVPTPPVARAPGRDARRPAVRSRIAVRRGASLAGRRVAVARTRCAARCRTELAVRRGRRTLRRTVWAPAGRWTPLTLSARQARRLGAGTLRVTVRVDGRVRARQRAVRLTRRLLGRLASRAG